MAKVIMVQGTMSGVGKSIICAGLCRIFAQDGYKTAPFKSQNMALNSYVTSEGLEIGRAQAVQAFAAGAEPSADMNPILLKPVTNMGSQVIVDGEVVGNMKAKEYYAMKHTLIPNIMNAYERLAGKNDIIVIEGAGSSAELNLKEGDFVNMGLAKMVDAPVLLVGDIDRGGVFAQLYGTVKLSEPDERERIKALIVNRFRGDISLFEDGVRQIEELCAKPVAGVVPMMDISLDDEDSISERLARKKRGNGADVAIIRTGKISNFTDMTGLELQDGLSVRYVGRADELGDPDMIILPGTKNTIEDLLELRDNGLEDVIIRCAKAGTQIAGICGGYQMLGEEIKDEEGVENGTPTVIKGMGLVPVRTVFAGNKVRTRIKGRICASSGIMDSMQGTEVTGYEIHMGRTEIIGGSEGEAFALLEDGREDGCILGNVFGTYLHGIFDSDGFRTKLTQNLLAAKGMNTDVAEYNYNGFMEEQFDRLADGLRNSLDMKLIYDILDGEHNGYDI
ncbi:MAG: cobyric acid synthase [Lachnospiraceae bacterium]|nr:cobyric acid synthase [Lachnospiraceae bacterium]